MMGATMWQSASLWHLKALSSRAACLQKRVLRSGYWQKIWPNSLSLVWENWGTPPLCPVKNRMQMGIWASLLPLICWQGPEDDNKGISAEIPEPVAATPRRADSTTSDSSCHSKESWLSHYGLKNKFVLPLEIVAMITIVVVNRTMPNDPLLKISDWTMNHIGLRWWLSPSCFL